jgi:N-acetylglucosamine kinase-like BadF-type ATPase
MSLVLGLDGGASKTLCLVANTDGSVLGFSRAGGSNHQVCGLSAAMEQITRCAREALAEAGASAPPVELGMFCLAGADLPEDYAMLTRAIECLALVRKPIVKNDTMAALRSGLSRSWGVVVVCGTGTNAAGRDPDGREIVLPGLGHISGDWGGGQEISQEMIRLIMRAWDGRGQPTMLLKMVLEELNLSSAGDLLHMLYHDELEGDRLLALVPLLFEAARAGDQVACELVRRVGAEVGITATTLIRRLEMQDKDVEVVLGGGIFKSRAPLLIDTIKVMVYQAAPRASIVLPRFEPVVGALLLSLEAAGIEVEGVVRKNFQASLPQDLVIETR